ncbi:MAG: hypothetical protein PVH07_07415 [Chloroflexota bacterium]|jgi:hypothetical protein
MIGTRGEAIAEAKATIERDVVDADQRAWLTASIHPYGSDVDAVIIHGLEGSPLRGLVIETPLVVFACDLGGGRLFTWHSRDADEIT